MADNLKHCFFYSKFSTTQQQILAACNNGDTFQFQHILGILSMTVGEGLGGFTVSTPKKDALGYEFLQVKITDNEQYYKQYVGNPIIQMDGTVDGNRILMFLPDETSFPAGFVIKFKEGDDYTKIFKYTEPVEVTRGAIVDLGDISDEIQHYDNPFSKDVKDLDTVGNANCYIITEPGSYKFKAVYGNEPTNYLQDVDDAVILWETWNDNSEVTPNSVLAHASFAEDFIILRTPETLHPGNALVAAKDAAGKILWSWHIWIPATPIVTANFGGIMGVDLMDRNLGALVAAEAGDAEVSPASYGMMYQWGRKDPFTAVPVGPQGPVHRGRHLQGQQPGDVRRRSRGSGPGPDPARGRHRESDPARPHQQRGLVPRREQRVLGRCRQDPLRPVPSGLPRAEEGHGQPVLVQRPLRPGGLGREPRRRLAQAGFPGRLRVPDRGLPRRL